MFNRKRLIISTLSISLLFLASCYVIRLIKGNHLALDFTYDLEAPEMLTFEEMDCSIKISSIHNGNKYTTLSASLINTSEEDLPLKNFKIWVLDNSNKTCENLSYYSQVCRRNSNMQFLCEFPNKYMEEGPIKVFAEYMDYNNHASYLKACSLSKE